MPHQKRDHETWGEWWVLHVRWLIPFLWIVMIPVGVGLYLLQRDTNASIGQAAATVCFEVQAVTVARNVTAATQREAFEATARSLDDRAVQLITSGDADAGSIAQTQRLAALFRRMVIATKDVPEPDCVALFPDATPPVEPTPPPE